MYINTMHLAVDSLHKSFDEENVLKNISFELEEGEFCILLGPSGCGKSTLLRCIAGLHEFEQGKVYLRGEETGDTRIEDRDLGYVFQGFEETLFPHMSVEGNIKFGLKQQDEEYSETEMQETIDEVLEVLSIKQTKDSEPTSLSGGQQQRVELARQLVREEDIILLDDPLGDLDYKLQKYMEIELRRYQRDLNSTFLYTTHDQDQALKLAEKIIVMNEGEIEQIGTPEEIYNSPANAFVHQFIGDSNTWEGTVEQVDSSLLVAQTDIGQVSASLSDTDPVVGDTVTLVIRPEDIVVGNNMNDLANSKQGEVSGLTFTGEETELSIKLTNFSEIVRAKVPESLPSSLVGNSIEIGWETKHMIAYGPDNLSKVGSVDPNSVQAAN